MNSSRTQLSQVNKRQNTIYEQYSALLFRNTVYFWRKKFSPSVKAFHLPEFQQSPKESKTPFSLYKEAQVPFFSRFKILVISQSEAKYLPSHYNPIKTIVTLLMLTSPSSNTSLIMNPT